MSEQDLLWHLRRYARSERALVSDTLEVATDSKLPMRERVEAHYDILALSCGDIAGLSPAVRDRVLAYRDSENAAIELAIHRAGRRKKAKDDPQGYLGRPFKGLESDARALLAYRQAKERLGSATRAEKEMRDKHQIEPRRMRRLVKQYSHLVPESGDDQRLLAAAGIVATVRPAPPREIPIRRSRGRPKKN